MDKFKIQDEQYNFPYHYIPYYNETSYRIGRVLDWGGEYMAYMRYIIQNIESHGVKSVLDVGCGDGRLCSLLKASGKVEKIKGVDLSEKAIGWAKMFNPDIEFEAIDVADEPEKYDAVALVEVIEHIPDESLSGFFNSVSRKISGGGQRLPHGSGCCKAYKRKAL